MDDQVSDQVSGKKRKEPMRKRVGERQIRVEPVQGYLVPGGFSTVPRGWSQPHRVKVSKFGYFREYNRLFRYDSLEEGWAAEWPGISGLLTQFLKDNGMMRVQMAAECLYERTDGKYDEAHHLFFLWFPRKEADAYTLRSAKGLPDLRSQALKAFDVTGQEIEARQSGWKFVSMNGIRLRMHKYQPLSGGDGVVPADFPHTQCIINPKGQSKGDCFWFSLLILKQKGCRHT
jgi:hypothetical protein